MSVKQFVETGEIRGTRNKRFKTPVSELKKHPPPESLGPKKRFGTIFMRGLSGGHKHF